MQSSDGSTKMFDDNPIKTPSPRVSSDELLIRLRAETRGEHEAIEKCIPLMNSSVRFNEYQNYLKLSWGFYRPLEQKIQKFLAEQEKNNSWPRDWKRKRQKTPLLECELRKLGNVLENIPQCQSLPSIETSADVWGSLYVLEGSTLGGQILMRHLEIVCDEFKQHAEEMARINQRTFLNPYGNETAMMRKAFCGELTNYHLLSIDRNATSEKVIYAANKTFQTLRQWIENNMIP